MLPLDELLDDEEKKRNTLGKIYFYFNIHTFKQILEN